MAEQRWRIRLRRGTKAAILPVGLCAYQLYVSGLQMAALLIAFPLLIAFMAAYWDALEQRHWTLQVSVGACCLLLIVGLVFLRKASAPTFDRDRPDFALAINQFWTAGAENGFNFFVNASIENHGLPSVATGWALVIDAPGANFHQEIQSVGRISEIPSEPDNEYFRSLRNLNIDPSTALEVKTAKRIATGLAVIGWLRFWVPLPLTGEQVEHMIDEATIDLSVADVLGNRRHVTQRLASDCNLVPPGMEVYCPGL